MNAVPTNTLLLSPSTPTRSDTFATQIAVQS
jgi:hypothetical protein